MWKCISDVGCGKVILQKLVDLLSNHYEKPIISKKEYSVCTLCTCFIVQIPRNVHFKWVLYKPRLFHCTRLIQKSHTQNYLSSKTEGFWVCYITNQIIVTHLKGKEFHQILSLKKLLYVISCCDALGWLLLHSLNHHNIVTSLHAGSVKLTYVCEEE